MQSPRFLGMMGCSSAGPAIKIKSMGWEKGILWNSTFPHQNWWIRWIQPVLYYIFDESCQISCSYYLASKCFHSCLTYQNPVSSLQWTHESLLEPLGQKLCHQARHEFFVLGRLENGPLRFQLNLAIQNLERHPFLDPSVTSYVTHMVRCFRRMSMSPGISNKHR